MSEWREGPPTEPGYGWVRCDPRRTGRELHLVRILPAKFLGKDSLYIEATSFEGGIPTEWITHHMPIPVPDPPTAEP